MAGPVPEAHARAARGWLLISAASGTKVEFLQPLVDAGIPVVQVLRCVDGRRFDYVAGNNRLGVRFATEHLLEQEHRRIAYLGPTLRTSVSEERFAGYEDALARRSIRLDASLVWQCQPLWSDAKSAMQGLLALRKPPTALVCFNDLYALGAMLALSQSGRQPGQDFAVVGYDDVELASVWQPGLTTVAVRPCELGREAANLLLERIAGSTRPPQRVLLAPRLVIRESCGAAQPSEVS